MRRASRAEKVILVCALLVLAGLGGFGLYRTATSNLPPPVWPPPDQDFRCWPAIDWDTSTELGTDADGRAFQEAATAIDMAEWPDALGTRLKPELQELTDAYAIALRRKKFETMSVHGADAAWDVQTKPLLKLEAVHLLLLLDILAQAKRDPNEALAELQPVLDATYDVARQCGVLGATLVWVLNLRRTLDVARMACAASRTAEPGTTDPQRELIGWSSGRTMVYEGGLDAMFIADYHETRRILSKLVQKSRRWVFTWLPYDVRTVATRVDECYVERFNLGIGPLWSEVNAPSWQPSAKGPDHSAPDQAQWLCDHSTDAWKVAVSLHKAASTIDERLTLLQVCGALGHSQ